MTGNKKILSKKAEEIAASRYYLHPEEGWFDCTLRTAITASSPEPVNQNKYRDLFHELIYNQDFIPGGRILRNSGRTRGSLFNCYFLPVGDSIEEIGQLIKDSLILWSDGGGVGINFSSLRPRGTDILGKGGTSSGLVSFIEATNAAARTIESGGSRRAAAIATVDVSHPEIMDFIDAKLVHGKLSSFNISVSINEDFLLAVEKNSTWDFKFREKTYNTVPARLIWDKIIENMINCAEPGLLNWTNFQKNNSYYFAPVCGTNPCHTGDTLVALADGRKLVSFKQLADEGKDVPVFCLNDKTGKIEVKIMRNPRLTGTKQKIYKVNLDNGMSFKCNVVHRVTLFDGSIKRVEDLKVNDRLHHMIKYVSSMRTVLQNNDVTKQDYVWMNNGFQSNIAEHRVVASYKIGRELTSDEVVHHKNYKYDDNSFENLEVMLKKNHDEFHIADMLGDKNPMRRFPDKNYFGKHKFVGSENGNYGGYNIEQIESICKEFIERLGRTPTNIEWVEYCKKNKITIEAKELIEKYKNIGNFIQCISKECSGIVHIDPFLIKLYKRFEIIKSNTDLDVFFDRGIKVNKTCEYCGNSFIVPWEQRERTFCTRACYNKSENKRESLIGNKHAVGCNFKVISIEVFSEDDVYNGTVDDHHNFYVYVGEDTTKNGRPKSHFINSRNCGETTLEAYGVCNLGSLVLPNYITGSVNTNWKKLETSVKIAVRFLDNIIEANKYSIKQIDINAHRSRRIGIGVLGVSDYLFSKKIKYGSEKSVQELEKLMRFIRDAAYQSSIEIAMEKGAFPAFDPIPYTKASFIRKLPASLRMDIKKYGIRNTTLMAIAPTGTISLVAECGSGIEPLYSKAYLRNDRVSERMYVHPLYEQYLKNGEEVPEWFVDSFDLQPKDHFEIQVAVQKYVDGSVSKTINMPKESTKEDLSKLLLEYIQDLKGVTVYRDGSREGQILNRVSETEVIKYLSEHVSDNNLSAIDVRCASGSCEI